MKALLLIWIILLIACTQTQLQGGVVVTIFPLAEFTRAVAGDRMDVTQLLPPGVEAHSFDPRPSDIVRLNNAELFIYIGSSMEPWAGDILKGAPQVSSLAAADFVAVLPAAEGGNNPHIWLDFESDQVIVTKIADELSAIDPNNTEYYQTNAAAYNKRLAALDTEYTLGLKDCTTRTIITNHEAFDYLAKRYDFTALSIYGITSDKEPSPRELQNLIGTAKEKKIKAVYYETAISPKVAEALASEVGVVTYPLNPGENADPGVSFITLMEDNLKNLRLGMGCS
jgi:zinc transport system substrate-binding protein